jgi:BirA family biotin operon repressor/biotin-[acetyl-CoA-carboxylase] ligase
LIKVLNPKGEWSGISRGVNESGELIVEIENGKLKTVNSGEVSVRGIYGYT